MNTRIQELAEQAEMAANNGDHVDVKIMMTKFAELIVQECSEVVGSLANSEDSSLYFWAIQNASQKILEHFDV